MSEVVHADIFFFITSIAVIAIAVGLVVFLYYAIMVARQVKTMVDRAEKVEKEVEHDIESVRVSMREEGVKTKAVADAIFRALGSIVAPRRRRAHHARSSSQK